MEGCKSKLLICLLFALVLFGSLLLPILLSGIAVAAPTWTQLTGGLADQSITAIEWDGAGVYAAVSNGNVWHYSVTTHTWSDTGGPQGKSINHLAWSGTQLYAGTSNNFGVWRYDPKTGSWTDTGGLGGYFITSLAADGSGVYAGAYYTPMPLTYYYNWIFHYDPAAGAWSLVLFEGTARNPLSYDLAWSGSSLYASAGVLNVRRYEPRTGAWSDTGKTGTHLAWAGSALYASDGNTSVINRYDPATGNWTTLPPVSGSGPAAVTSLVSAGPSLLALGYESTTTGKVWRYDPGAGSWADLSQAELAFNCAVCADSSIYAGASGKGVWRLGPEVVPHLSIASIAPNSGMDINAGLAATIAGSDFKAGATVRLENTSAAKVIDATNVNVVSANEINCTFDLTGAALGAYDLIVSNPGGNSVTLAGGFSVTAPSACGFGSGLGMLMLGISLGLLSLAGSIRVRHRKK